MRKPAPTRNSFEVVRVGIQHRFWNDAYHSMLTMRWSKFLGLIAFIYFLTNLFFAFLYFACGGDAISGLDKTSVLTRFLDNFFFSVQTFATIGYGKMVPESLAANLLVTAEALVGLMGLALATGLLFARFSRPTARVLFSNIGLITRHKGVPCFMFRIANRRNNQIVDAEVNITLIATEKTVEGKSFRTLVELPPLRNRNPALMLTWTVIHNIDEKSPLYGMTAEKLIERRAQIMITLIGIDDTFSQSVSAKYYYNPQTIVWNHSFDDMIEWNEKGVPSTIDLTKIHDISPLPA